jgi:hypothetical protein
VAREGEEGKGLGETLEAHPETGFSAISRAVSPLFPTQEFPEGPFLDGPLEAHLQLPSVPQTWGLVTLTLLRILAYMLSLVFYHRQVVSHARQAPPMSSETARLLAYLFLPRASTPAKSAAQSPCSRPPGALRPPLPLRTQCCLLPGH